LLKHCFCRPDRASVLLRIRMPQVYRAILTRDHVEWQEEPPLHDRPVHVQIVVLEPVSPLPPPSQGEAMAAALKQIADMGGLPSIGDPAAWQKDTRKDRELPGRNG
jgi:hypothetical protein